MPSPALLVQSHTQKEAGVWCHVTTRSASPWRGGGGRGTAPAQLWIEDTITTFLPRTWMYQPSTQQPRKRGEGSSAHKGQTLRPMELEDQLRFTGRTWSEAWGIVSSTRLREYLLLGQELMFSR